jgi:hypothetical protein
VIGHVGFGATMSAMEAMIARWHGPTELPQVRGGADLTR